MARIAGVDIPREKRVEVALTYVFGIGLPTSQKILAQTNINPDTRVRDLTEEQVNRLRERPQWYNALTDNCTTAIQRIARIGARRSWWSWKLFLNGYLDELAYDIGASDRSLPFAVLHPTGDDARRRWEARAPGSVPGSTRASRHRR